MEGSGRLLAQRVALTNRYTLLQAAQNHHKSVPNKCKKLEISFPSSITDKLSANDKNLIKK